MNLAPRSPPRRRDEARALFRNAILDAAEAVFAEHGFHGAHVQDIADRARIAVGTNLVGVLERGIGKAAVRALCERPLRPGAP